ncbi:MAG: hypothetical protein HPZ78_05770 [Barnesiella sp.]|nr:hypothetical protein [Barnesiella sp.]
MKEPVCWVSVLRSEQGFDSRLPTKKLIDMLAYVKNTESRNSGNAETCDGSG